MRAQVAIENVQSTKDQVRAFLETFGWHRVAEPGLGE